MATLLMVLGSLAGSTQRAISAHCAGSAAGPVSGSTSLSPDRTVAATGDAATPPAIPSDGPSRVACGGSVALPIAPAASRDLPPGPRQPIGQATVFTGADAPEPLLGPPRLS